MVRGWSFPKIQHIYGFQTLGKNEAVFHEVGGGWAICLKYFRACSLMEVGGWVANGLLLSYIGILQLKYTFFIPNMSLKGKKLQNWV